MEYVPEGGTYTLDEIAQRTRALPLGDLASVPTSEAPAIRQKRLVDLRGHGPDARALADALTDQFPTDHAAVPMLIEGASVDGRDVWVVVEAWGERDAYLAHRRLWLIDRVSYEIVSSLSFR